MKAIASVLAGVVVVSAVAGCGGPYRAKTLSNTVLKSERIVFVDAKVARYLRVVTELPPKRLDGGELQVGAVFANVKGKDLRCDVKVLFIDIDGGEVDSTTWEPEFFQRATEKTIRKNSLDPAAADYRLYVRLQK